MTPISSLVLQKIDQPSGIQDESWTCFASRIQESTIS